jgi:Protein of unknown function (DUF445)
LRGLNGYIDAHREELRQHLSKRSRRWLPTIVDHKLFDRVLDGVSSVLVQMEGDHDHELRLQLKAWLAQLIVDLETSPDLRARGERLKADVLARPEVRQWIASLWADIKIHVRSQASDPDSTLQQRLTSMIIGLGHRLQHDQALAAKVQGAAESTVSYVAEHFNGAIAGMVSTTIARWDSDETATRLELLLGPDLQYVRINGTVMGAGAGLSGRGPEPSHLVRLERPARFRTRCVGHPPSSGRSHYRKDPARQRAPTHPAVEAAWAYQHQPYVGTEIAKRHEKLPPEVVAGRGRRSCVCAAGSVIWRPARTAKAWSRRRWPGSSPGSCGLK